MGRSITTESWAAAMCVARCVDRDPFGAPARRASLRPWSGSTPSLFD